MNDRLENSKSSSPAVKNFSGNIDSVPKVHPERRQPIYQKKIRSFFNSKLRILFNIVLAILILVLCFYLYSLWQTTAIQYQSRVSFIENLKQHASFPLLYPGKLPEGFSVDFNSLQITSSIVLYAVRASTGTLIITEQAKPATTEEVKKRASFKTSAGEASIVDLEGHVMGFLKTSQTLVIISGLRDDQDSQLRFILENLQPATAIPN